MMIIYKGFFVTAAAAVLIFSITSVSYQQSLHHFADQEGGACVSYEPIESAITIVCDHTSFRDVIGVIDDPTIITNIVDGNGSDGQYLLNATLIVDDGITFSMNSNNDEVDNGNENNNLQYLKIAGENGIIVHGRILIDGIKITSWNVTTNDVIQQNSNGSIKRAYIQFAASKGSEITNSEFAYLGYQEFGKRGFDLFGDGGPSRDMVIRGNEFHHMWRAFYSTGAYNITIDRNEYHHNIEYGIDPHSRTHNMNITNNWIHHDPIGIICSLDCYNILIEGNKIENSTRAGIFFSRNMYESIARNNHIFNTSIGIILSQSSSNQIYNNTIEATDSGILLFNPASPDEGLTENNLVYINTISDSSYGINATRSHNNILADNKFSNIGSSEYHLNKNSNIRIIAQHFDNASITSGNGSTVGNIVEIVNSGGIEVTEANDDDSNSDQGISEKNYYYNTDNRLYRKVLGDNNSITVDSHGEYDVATLSHAP